MPKPSVLVIHNYYQQAGGEDTVVRAEVNLLRGAGHRVVLYTRNNSEIAGYNLLERAWLGVSASWNRRTYAEIKHLIGEVRPDVVHCHNILPLVSPSAYYACRTAGVPVAQTLHNYRLVCPAGTLFKGGKRCDRCRSHPTAAMRDCYRGSHLQTAAVSCMLGLHRWRGTWKHAVGRYLVPSHFCRDYFVNAGFPADKVHLKPNFLSTDPGLRGACDSYALFAGRLCAEKGVLEMIAAWRDLPEIPLVIAGDGPLYRQARRMAEDSASRIKFLGTLPPGEMMACIKRARLMVFPSQWYEPFGMGLLEAAACGVPAIASRIGAIPELVQDRRTGLLFDPDNLTQLTECVRWAWGHPAEMAELGGAARELYLQQFTAERNYELLMKAYRGVMDA